MNAKNLNGVSSHNMALFWTALLLSLLTGGLMILLLPVTWEIGVLTGLLVFITAGFVRFGYEIFFAREAPREITFMPDAASPEEMQAALEHLAGLPHFRRLSNGTLFDYLQGTSIRTCACGRESPFHLLVEYSQGKDHCLELVSRGALAQFLAVQDAVAAQLTRPVTEGGAA